VSRTTLVLSRSDVERLLDMPSCIGAVEDAFRKRADGQPAPSAMLGIHAAQGGFHAKAAMLELSRPYFVTKINANFPGNGAQFGLPTIQGVLVLVDASCGTPLAVMDSMAITTLRTAAASAVAAARLATADAGTATFIGCGVQTRAHIAAIHHVRPLRRIFVSDVDAPKAERLADEMRELYRIDITVAGELSRATRASQIVVTCTSATTPFLGPEHVAPGTFVAAVGADNAHKSEISPALLHASSVVVDDLEQCATIGDLHHAIDAGLMTRQDVRATLGEVVTGRQRGRTADDEVVIFDSTGVAIEDVAAAAVTYERAVRQGARLEVRLSD
jgi:alanine dehydrogenase